MNPHPMDEDLLIDDDELIVIDFDEVEEGAARGRDPRDGDYPGFQRWIKERGLRLIDAQIHAERLSRWAVRPKFLMVCVVREGELPLVARTLASLERQLYKDWIVVFISDVDEPSPVFRQSDCLGWVRVESVEDAASVTAHINELPSVLGSDWIALLPPGFELEEQALLVLGDYINLHPEWAALYTDDYVSDGAGNFSRPRFKPDFDIDYLRAYDYVGVALWFNATALEATGGPVELGDATFYEMLLRTWERVGDQAIGHIAEPLLRLPLESVQDDADSPMHDAAVTAHLERIGAKARLQKGFFPGIRRIVRELPVEPSVSIIVPTRDKIEFLAPCVESIFEKTAYGNYEVVIVDNQSEDPDTLVWFGDSKLRFGNKLKVLSWDKPFNFAEVNNFACSESQAEFLCLLNNDTEVIHAEWLKRLVEDGSREDVGVVGCRLMFPESAKVQHVGVVGGMGGLGVAEHPFIGQFTLEDRGPLNFAQVLRNSSAVTAACMLVKRSDYINVGGMDEDNLKVLYNDVDLCFKIRESGKRVLWTPYATLVHHGNVSVGASKDLWKLAEAHDRTLAEKRFMVERWPGVLGGDPFYNRNLSLVDRDWQCETAYRLFWNPDFFDRKRILAVPLPGGSGMYRYVDPLTALSDAGKAQSRFVMVESGAIRFPSSAELLRLKPDSFCLHGALADSAVDVLREVRAVLPGTLRVFALDDLVTQIPVKSNLYRHFKSSFRDARARLRAVLRDCDRLIVSTEPLVDVCRDMIEDIVVVPNRLSDDWRGLNSRRNVGERPRVGWVGASQHQGDLELIESVIEALRDQVDFVFMGMATDAILPLLKEFHQPVPWKEYPAKLASLNLDIALAPLELVPFNEAKSNLRLLEYGIFGWPVVCTDIFPYQQDKAPVTRVPNDPDAWIEAIRALAADPDRRAREGDALQQWVTSRYMLTDHLDEWMRAFLG